MAAVVGVVEHGGAIPEEQREHIKHCARCRELLDSANQFESAIEEEKVNEPHVDDRRLVREVRALRARDIGKRIALAALIAIVITATFAFFVRDEELFTLGQVLMISVMVTAFAVIPLLILWAILAALRDRNGNRISKRLGPGRQVSGVCLGLSEATGTSVLVFRLGFIALTLADGIGLVLYIFLALAMPVHPDDRQHLLRFKLRRMWQRRFAHAADDAG
jgi:phage shock protein PspC (stress-responsive transcriptional regulator)